MKTILITDANANNKIAIETIKELESDGYKVVYVPENKQNMRKSDLAGIFALAAMGESMLHCQPEKLRAEDIDLIHGSLIKEEKRIPKGCRKWNIGKYEVIAINRKNAIRKALKLRFRDFNCC